MIRTDSHCSRSHRRGGDRRARADAASLDRARTSVSPPSIVGVVMDTSRAPGSPGSARDGRSFGRRFATTDGLSRRGRPYARPRHREVPRRRAAGGARSGGPRGVARAARSPTRPRMPTSIIVQHRSGRRSRGGRGGAQGAACGRREYAQAAYRVRQRVRAERSALRHATVEPAGHRPRARLGHPAGAGSVITVAVLDTGMAFRSALVHDEHPGVHGRHARLSGAEHVTIPFAAADQLVNAVDANRFVAPHDFIWDDDIPLDFDGHGTHVAGTIGQLTNDNIGPAGVAFNVKLMPIKVIDGVWDVLFGSPNFATDDPWRAAIRYAADNGAKVLNMSIGRSGPAVVVVEDAIRYAVGRGAFVAIAAGNEYRGRQSVRFCAEICSRGQRRGVGGRDRSQQGARLVFDGGPYVEIAAPGGDGSAGVSTRSSSADLRLQFHGHLSAAAVAVPGAAVRCPRRTSATRDVHGDAACRRRGGDPDAAGHHQPGGDRGRAEADRRRPRHAGPGQLLRLRPDQRRATRMFGIGAAK